MDNFLLGNELDSSYVEKSHGFYIMVMMIISSWSNSCIMIIWPLLTISDFLNLPFKIALFFLEVGCCFLLSFISDVRGRKTSMKYSLKMILLTTIILLLILMLNLILDQEFINSNMLSQFRRKDNWIGFGKEVIYDNILFFDESVNVLSIINNKKKHLEDTLIFNGESNNEKIFLNNSDRYIRKISSITLFLICCILHSSSINLYYTLNLFIVENNTCNDDESVNDLKISGWCNICYFNIGRYATILLARITFISILVFLLDFNSNGKNEINYICVYCVNLLLLLILTPFGIYVVNNKLNYISNNQNTTQINDLNIYIKNVTNYIFSKQSPFWFLLVPWWIINFIQTGNNFHQWILIDENSIQVELWEFYSLFYESIVMLGISILIPFLTTRFSPATIQIYCFVILSIVSFGLTLSTYTIYEIPVKTFIDFICAFSLCHGIFHLCCIVPYITILFLTIDSTNQNIKSVILATMHSIIATAPLFDHYINSYSIKVINISIKLFSITIIVLIGLIFTGIFVNKYSSEESYISDSFELLPTYTFNYKNYKEYNKEKFNTF